MLSGAIDAVNSVGGVVFVVNGMVLAFVVFYVLVIFGVVLVWNGAGVNDISNWSGGVFCTHVTSWFYWGDVDNNGELDVICYDFSTGIWCGLDVFHLAGCFEWVRCYLLG